MNSLDCSISRLRRFALLLFILLLFIAAYRTVYHHIPWDDTARWELMVLEIAAVSVVFPVILYPLYRQWMRVSFVLGWIISRVLLISLYYLLLTPIALLMRLIGKDLLKKKFSDEKSSYWIAKETIRSSNNYEKLF
jgi:membrane-associated HD superfamily phosphohydrolase